MKTLEVSSGPSSLIRMHRRNRTALRRQVNVGILNNEVKSKGWAEVGGKLLKLKTDVQRIFENQHGIQIALFSDVGNMLDKLSHSSGGSHPTAEEIFEGIITDLGLTHIQVKANAPYVALIDTTCWRVRTCELIDNVCDKKRPRHSALDSRASGDSRFRAMLQCTHAIENIDS